MANETVGTMKDRVEIITGGSRGLGRNTAVNLAGRGVNLIFTYRSNQKEADSLIREVEAMERKAVGFRLDTGDIHAFDGFVADVRKTLQGWGRDRLDYLVTVEDPTTWTRPFSFDLPWRSDDPTYVGPDDLFEYACHEGNYRMMENSITAAKAVRAAQAGKK